MMTAYTVIHADGSRESHQIDIPKRPEYRVLNPIIKAHIGAPFERVSVWHDGQSLDMFVDENGRGKALPRNETATAIYRANTLRLRPETDPETMAFIVGPAVIFARPVWF